MLRLAAQRPSSAVPPLHVHRRYMDYHHHPTRVNEAKTSQVVGRRPSGSHPGSSNGNSANGRSAACQQPREHPDPAAAREARCS